MAAPLERRAVAAVDSTGQAAEILDLPAHLRDALWRVDSAGIAPVDAPGGVVVAGMGGSAVGGRLAQAALGPRLDPPVRRRRRLRAAVLGRPASTLVLCSSYSGDTEETLAAYDDALERGAPRLVATTGGALAERARRDRAPVIPLPGGFQPRAAVGYGLVSALEAAALGRRRRRRCATRSRRPPRWPETLAAEWGPDGAEDGEAKALARALHGTVPVIAGAELTAPVAYRWKCQINENAGLPAFASTLPELDHNEVVGWPGAAGLGPFSAVFLEDAGAHPRNALRSELTAARGRGGRPRRRARRRAAARRRLERLVSLVLLGDLVSLYLAVLAGTDPVDIAPIDRLKASLANR